MNIVPTVTYPSELTYRFYEQRTILQEIAIALMRPWTHVGILDDSELEFQVFSSLTTSLSTSETVDVFKRIIQEQKHRLSFLVSGTISTNLVVALDFTPIKNKQELLNTLLVLNDIKKNHQDPFHMLLQPVWVSRQRVIDSRSSCLQIAECDLGTYVVPEHSNLSNSYRVVVSN